MQIQFEHTFADALEGLYVPWTPQGFPAPTLLTWNASLAASLGIETPAPEVAARLLSGTEIPKGARPVAQAYAGHQFGGFSPQLGDGRALLLGEVVDAHGQRFDIHLKGSGPTPFSRGGDGKATVGPVLREYILGEAMFHLGVPTSRVLATIRTGETVMRDRPLPGAVLARVASSHLRVGTLEYLAARNERDGLQKVVRYALQRHYPDRLDAGPPARELLRVVALAQAQLIAQWMLIGFIHGVMNTDNMTLSGETIDYGPCAFMEAYDPATVFSSIDHRGRYAFGNQPAIGQWNLARMGEALLAELAEDEDEAVAIVHAALDLYGEALQNAWRSGMRTKLGLLGSQENDDSLVADLLTWMQENTRDFTNTFRDLASGLRDGVAPAADPEFEAWNTRWQARLGDEDRRAIATRMDAVNPIYIPRNHRVERALDAAIDGDLTPLHDLLEVLATPFEARPGYERFAEPAPPGFGPYRTFCGT